jgi:hypothetical protein
MGGAISLEPCFGGAFTKLTIDDVKWMQQFDYKGIFDLDVNEKHVGTLLLSPRTGTPIMCGGRSSPSHNYFLTVSELINNDGSINSYNVRFNQQKIRDDNDTTTSESITPPLKNAKIIELEMWDTGSMRIIVLSKYPDNDVTLHSHPHAFKSDGEKVEESDFDDTFLRYEFRIPQLVNHLKRDHFEQDNSVSSISEDARDELTILHQVCSSMNSTMVDINFTFLTPFNELLSLPSRSPSPGKSQPNPIFYSTKDDI